MPRANLIQVRQDSGPNWSTVNPVLAKGEPGWAVGLGLKVGDGVTPWNGLVYVGTKPAPGGGTMSFVGALQVLTGTMRLYNDTGVPLLISKVRVALGSPPAGQGVIVDVLRNGVSLFTAGKPTVPDGAATAVAVPTTKVWADGDYLTVDVLQVGTTQPGKDMTVTVVT